jgi:hypothetical protein
MTAIILINLLLSGAVLCGLAFVMSRLRDLRADWIKVEPASSDDARELDRAA